VPTPEDLERLYRAATDDEVAEAYAAGAGTYTPAAWQIVAGEFERRQHIRDAVTATDDQRNTSLADAAHTAPPELTPAALDGRSQLHGVAALLLVTYIATSAVSLLLGFSFGALFSTLVRLAILLLICDGLRNGRGWAGPLTAVLTALGGMFWLWITVLRFAAQPLVGVLTGGIGILYFGVSVLLTFSPNIAEFVRLQATLRTHPATPNERR